jgi:hypothetical protein
MRSTLILIMAVCVALTPAAHAAFGDWQPGPDAILDNTYNGGIDLPPAGSTLPLSQPVVISGWVVDTAADGWAGIDDVNVYEGDAGQGGRFLGQASYAQSRPDVAQALGSPFWADSGFVLTLSPGTLGVGGHLLTVYAHTPGKGWWSTQVFFTISAPAPSASLAPPVNMILSPRGTTIPRGQDRVTIKGYALDPNATADIGIDHVEVYLDELRGRSDAKFIGIADLGHNQSSEAASAYGLQFLQSGYQIDLKLTKLDPGSHHIYTYAKSSITGQETMDGAGFNIGS